MENKEYGRNLGCIPSPWDSRNLQYLIRVPSVQELQQIPEEFDELSNYCYCHGTQGNIGSCCGWAGSGLEHTLVLLNDSQDVLFSAGSIYAHSKEQVDPPIPQEAEGSSLLGVLKFIQKVGAPPETFSPTDILQPFHLLDKPGWEIVAGHYRINSYHRVPTDEDSMKAAIYGLTFKQPYAMPDGSSGKSPLLVAIPVYDCFYNTEKGISALPIAGEKLWGYHAVLIRGWKKIEGKLHWVVVNSWGTDTGDKGIYYIPFSYPIAEAWLVTDDAPHLDIPNQSDIEENCILRIIRAIIKILNKLTGGA